MEKENLLQKIEEAAGYIAERANDRPEVGIILGTGLGGLTERIDQKCSIDYTEIPHFPVSTVEGHKGRLIFGELGGRRVVAMQGRFHYYEGYSMKQVTFPIRVMKELGVKYLLVSNAAGGMNPNFQVGDLMVITDHINLFPEHPLRGKNDPQLGVRFPNMSDAYSKGLIQKVLQIARDNHIPLQQGVYVGTQGPTYETPAEYKYFRTIGGDAVGMSTVPEVIVARHSGMEVFAISVITDLGVEGIVETASHENVQKAASQVESQMTLIMKNLIDQF